jgi:hypothetical protein
MVSDYSGNVRVFPTHADGQHAPDAPVGQSYGVGNAVGLASSGGNIYMAQQTNADVVQLNNTGTFNQSIVSGLSLATGLVTDPTTGNLYVSGASSPGFIVKIDPIAKTKTTFVSNLVVDGLAINSAGSILYAAAFPAGSPNGKVLGFSLADGSIVFDSGNFLTDHIDGIAIGGTGPLANKLYVNTLAGTLIEVDLATKAQILMFTGGGRGDFVTVDPLNGTLLVTQTSSILRLTPIAGGFDVPGNVPLPATLPLFLAGLGVVALMARRKRAKVRELV